MSSVRSMLWKRLFRQPGRPTKAVWPFHKIRLCPRGSLGQPGNRTHCRTLLRSFLKQSGLGILWSYFWVSHEQPKVILKRGIGGVISRSAFHFIGLAMTIVLSYLHISGFYIGASLEAWQNSGSEGVKQLLIQVAAKLLELVIISSLTTILVDVVRSLLLWRSIPLGLLTAHTQFSNPGYFLSEDFWAAFWGFEKKRQFLSVALLFMLCGALGLLTGPATAVLLMPAWRTMWYAGGTGYWLAGSPDTIWPHHLTINNIGTGWASESCLNATKVGQVDQLVSLAGCTWAGYGSLRAEYGQSHQRPGINVTLSDGFQDRLIVCPYCRTPC